MPCYIRVGNCCSKGHELTVHLDPIEGDTLLITWGCDECKAEGETTGEPSAPDPQGYSALGGVGSVEDNVVQKAARVSRVKPCHPGCQCAKHDPTPFLGNPNWEAEFDAKRAQRRATAKQQTIA